MIIEAVGSGSLVGFTLGLIGGGGSILATPLLLYFVGVRDPHVAIGTSALAVSVNAYVNLISHAIKGNVRWKCAVVFALVGVFGTLIGTSLGKSLDGQALLFVFGMLMLVIGALMLKPKRQGIITERDADSRTCLTTAAVAFVAGATSGFFGIGGGFLIVPALMASTRMPMINAVGSSLLAVGTFGLATAASYAWSGMVDWPVAFEFIAGGVIGGVAGMLLASRLASHKQTLNRIFAVLIFAVAIYVLYRSGTTLFA